MVNLETRLSAHFHAIAQQTAKGHGSLLRPNRSHQMIQPTLATNALKPETHSTLPKVSAPRIATEIPSFDELPDSALARQSQLVRDPKHPTRPTPLPFSPATFWRKVKDGTFPKPVKLSARITAWRVGDVREWIAAQGAE